MPAELLVHVQQVIDGLAREPQTALGPSAEPAFVSPVAEDVTRFGEPLGDVQDRGRLYRLDILRDRLETTVRQIRCGVDRVLVLGGRRIAGRVGEKSGLVDGSGGGVYVRHSQSPLRLAVLTGRGG